MGSKPLRASVAPVIAASEEQSDKWIIDQTSWLQRHRVINIACNSVSETETLSALSLYF